MKKFLNGAILLGAAMLAAQSGFAQSSFVAGDLYMGFENNAGGGTYDYIIYLGPASGIVGGSAVLDLSSHFSLTSFDAVLGSSATANAGVVGGLEGSPSYIYFTQLRNGWVGAASVPDSTEGKITRTGINGAVSTLTQVSLPTAVQGSILTTNLSWETYVEPTLNGSTFYGNAPNNPAWPVGPAQVLYEDLWAATNGTLSGSTPLVYQGYFTLDLTGSSPVFTFTPSAAVLPLTTVPTVVSVGKGKSGGAITVVAGNTLPTYTYQLQYTTSLSSPTWNNVGTSEVASTSTVTLTDPTPTDTQRFYRVQGH